jgi:hypothetical protein
VKAQLAEKREQDLLDQLALTAGVEVRLKQFAALQFGARISGVGVRSMMAATIRISAVA